MNKTIEKLRQAKTYLKEADINAPLHNSIMEKIDEAISDLEQSEPSIGILTEDDQAKVLSRNTPMEFSFEVAEKSIKSLNKSGYQIVRSGEKINLKSMMIFADEAENRMGLSLENKISLMNERQAYNQALTDLAEKFPNWFEIK